ncbi:MAG: hypothetical protein AB7F22_34895 [Reyranella sp.]|uniref:hypothetical protein n=1 Tax=Reyranella sp. TaxID=1929291 RepID=UPI003D116652
MTASSPPILMRHGDAPAFALVPMAGLDGEVLGPDALARTAREIEDLTAERAHALVGELADASDYNAFRLGGVLAKILAEKWYASAGYVDFASYVERRHGFKRRKAYYLVQIYNAVSELGLGWDELKPIGWTKLKELAPVLASGNAAEWLARAAAPGMTVSKLRDLVQACRAETPARFEDVAPGRTTIRTFDLDDEQLRMLNQALTKAKAEAGTDLDAAALAHIARNYLGPSDRVVERHLTSIGLVGALSLLERSFPEADLKVEANRPEGDCPEDQIQEE